MLYFLIGLGIIMLIVAANSVYDWIREKKGLNKPEEDETAEMSELASLVLEKIKNRENIFGLPLTFCEKISAGTFVALDREEDIYLVETDLRGGYDDIYNQVIADLKEQARRTGKKNRRVYAIVCQDEPSELLIAGAKANPAIRIFRYDKEKDIFINIS